MHLETTEPTEDADPVMTDAAWEEPGETVTTSAENCDTSASVSAPLASFDDKIESTSAQDEEEKPVKFGKIGDPHALGCCEFCGGPVKRRRFCSPLKRFCSKSCSRSSRKAKV